MPTMRQKKRQYMFPGKLKILAQFGTMAEAARQLDCTTESLRRAAKGLGCRHVAERLAAAIGEEAEA